MSKNDETIHLIDSIKSLINSLSYRDLDSPEIQKSIRDLRDSQGFKKIIGKITSVHTIDFGISPHNEGDQRFRNPTDLDYNIEGFILEDLICVQAGTQELILQVFKGGKWLDATKETIQ